MIELGRAFRQQQQEKNIVEQEKDWANNALESATAELGDMASRLQELDDVAAQREDELRVMQKDLAETTKMFAGKETELKAQRKGGVEKEDELRSVRGELAKTKDMFMEKEKELEKASRGGLGRWFGL